MLKPCATPGSTKAQIVLSIPSSRISRKRGIDPTSAGKAVVSVDISPEVIAYRDEIFLASDHDSFVHQIDAALAAANTHHDRRRQLAFANDWQEKADQFSMLIKSLAK